MVAIVTKWRGPTNSRGSRIVVRSEAGAVSRIVVPWDDGKGVEDNHIAAAHEYARRNDWLQDCYGKLVSGSVPDGYVFVFVKDPTLATDGGTYTCEPGREIHRDGKPFVGVTREGDTKPVVADYVTRRFVAFLNGKADA